MLKVAVVFGGRSVEHDVSIVTGLQLLENIDKSKYDAFALYISRSGGFYIGEKLRDAGFYKNFNADDKGIKRVHLLPSPDTKGLYAAEGAFGKLKCVQGVDVCVLAMHGLNGEDGTLQGLIELADIPYTSVGVLGSSAGMDKILMKEAFRGMGLPVLPSVYFYRDELGGESRAALLEKAEALGYPLFVKPANLGSSIGITKAKDRASLEAALEVAAGFDRRILVEKGVEEPVELNCACFGYGASVTPSLCEQPVSWDEFLTFDEKYMRGSKKSGGMASLKRKIPAPIPDALTERIQSMTCEIFKAFDGKGVVRVDYILNSATNELFVNEINTIPGSFAFYLFEPMGISFSKLIDHLIEFAQKAHADKNKSIYAYDSNILKQANLGGAKARRAK